MHFLWSSFNSAILVCVCVCVFMMASSSRDGQLIESKGQTKLSSQKVVLPTELLKDIQDTEAKGCLDNDSSDGFFYIPNFITEAEEEHIIDKIRSAPQPKWRTLHARSGEKIGRLQNWGGQVTKQALISEQLPEFLTSFPPLIERIRETGAFEGSKHGEPNHCVSEGRNDMSLFTFFSHRAPTSLLSQLMNEYEPGQGILPHEDGSAYFSTVATVSLGSHTILDIYRYASQDVDQIENGKPADSSAKAREQLPRFSILQEPRSLLITRGSAYKFFLHGIAERQEDEQQHLATITNGDMILDPAIRDAVSKAKDASSNHSLPRQLRYSLTLRDVERVAPKNLMAMMMGKQ